MTINSSQAKKWLRSYLRKERAGLSKSQKKEFNRKTVKRIQTSPLFKKARVISTFIGFGSEVDTWPLITAAWKAKKIVVIPDTRHGFAKPNFAIYEPSDRLKPTRFGPLELAKPKAKYPPQKVDLLFVPGLGFDGNKHRLGFGGGVYDRLIKACRRARSVGIFYSCQQVRFLPFESHDQRLNAIATEKEWL